MKMHRLTLICLFQMMILSCFGQQFTYVPGLQFGIKTVKPDSTRKAQNVFFYDYDDDGDLDLFLSGLDYFDNVSPLKWKNLHFFIDMQENTGSRTNPQFGPREDVFTQFPYPVGYFFADGGDLNDDHKMDLITMADINSYGSEQGRLLMNTGLHGAGEFQVSTLDAIGLRDFVPESMFYPNLVDADGDGDADLMMSGFDSAFGEEDGPDVPVFYYARNVGSKTSPEFEGWYENPYSLSPHSSGEILESGDIDNDGDMDFVGSLINIPADSLFHLYVHINTPGPDGKPAFNSVLESPYGLPTTHGTNQLVFPSLVDIDGDGDLDMFVFDGNSQNLNLRYYQNQLCQPITEDLEELICEGEVYTVGNETFDVSGDYMIQLTAANGCDSLVFLTLHVDVIDPTVISIDDSLIAQQVDGTYQWYNCDTGEDIPGAVSQEFEVTVTGNYAVHIVDAAGCTGESACTHVIISSLKDDPFKDRFTVYPNPGSDILYIINHSDQDVYSVTLYTISGQLIGDFIPNEKHSIDVSGIGSGVYFMKIYGDRVGGYVRLVVF